MKQTELKMHREADERGLELVGPGRNSHYRTYVFRECRHQQEIEPSKVRKNMFTCQACIAEKLEQEATDEGLELVGPGRTIQFRSYLLPCGHTQELTTQSVRLGTFKCRTCGDSKTERKLQPEAIEQGLVLLGAGRNASYRRYKFIGCGHEQEITTNAVRYGSFACHTCGEHSWTKPSDLYVIRVSLDDGQSFIKLGYSKNIPYRIKSYGLPHYATAKVLATATFRTREEADVAESMLFTRYAEWHIPSTEVDDIFTRSGSTEVYHHSIEDSARLFVRDLDFLIKKGQSK